MADELYRAIVSLQLNDGDLVGKVADATEQVTARLRRLAQEAGIQLGVDLSQFDAAQAGVVELQQQLERLAQVSRQVQSSFTSGGAGVMDPKAFKDLDRMVQGTQRLLDLSRQLSTVQSAAGPNIGAAEQSILAQRLERDRARLDAATALTPVQRKFFETGMEQGKSLDELTARGSIFGHLRDQIPAFSETPNGRLRASSAEALEQEILAQQADPNAERLKSLRARVLQAEENHARATEALARSYDEQAEVTKAEDRFRQTYAAREDANLRLTAYLEKQAKLEQEATKAAEGRAAAKDDPRQAMLDMSNEDFLKAQGFDLSKSAGINRIEAEIRKTAVAQQDLEAKRREAKTQEDITKIIEARKALAIKELQLQSQLADQQKREVQAGRGDGGFLGGLFGQNSDDDGFGQGFAFDAGVTLKYFAFYSIFAAIQQVMIAVKDATKEYTLAVNQLAIALGASYDEARKMADEYATIGDTFGQGPTVALNSAAKYLRTYRNEDGSPDQAAGQIGARVGSIIYTLEPRDHADDTQQDLIALAKAYGIGPEGSEGLLDKMLAVSRFYGYESPGEILPGVAAVGDIGKESGYSPEQLAALIASVMQQTGVGSDAAAGDIKRFLGSQNDPGLIQLFDRFGIDQDATLREKLVELSERLSHLDPEAQARELVSAGNPRIAAAVVAAIRGIPMSEKAEEKALDSTGLASEAAQKKLETFAGKLQELGSEFEELYTQLSESGVGTIMGVGLDAFIASINLLAELTRTLNQLPEPIKAAAGALALLLAAAKAQAVLTGVGGFSGIASRLVGGAGVGAGAAGAGRVPSLGGFGAISDAAVDSMDTRTMRAAGGLTNVATAAGRMAAALAPAAAALAAVSLVSETINSKDRADQGEAAGAIAGESLEKAIASGDPERIRVAIEELERAREEQAKGLQEHGGSMSWWRSIPVVGGWSGLWSEGGAFGPNSMPTEDPRITQGKKELEELLAAERRLQEMSPTSEWFGRNYNNVSRGVGMIETKGVGADRTIQIVEDLLRQDPRVVQAAIQPGEGQKGLPELTSYIMNRIGASQDPTAQAKQYGDYAEVLTNMRETLRKQVDVLGQRLAEVQAAGGDTGEIDGQIATAQSQLAALEGQLDVVNKAWVQSMTKLTRMKIDALKRSYAGAAQEGQIRALLTEAMTAAAESGDINTLVELMNGADAAFNEQIVQMLEARARILADFRDGLAEAAANAASALASMDRTDPRVRNELAEMGQRDTLGDQARANAEAKAAEDAARSAREAMGLSAPTGADTYQVADALTIAEMMAAVEAGDGLSQAGATLNAAKVKLDRAVKGTAEWYDATREVNEAQRAYDDAMFNAAQAELAASVEPGNPLAAAKTAITQAQAALDHAVDPTEYWNAQKALNEAKYSLARTELQIAQARLSASEIPGDPLSAATNAVKMAQQTLAFTNDDAEYWNAVKQLRQAQYEQGKIALQMTRDRTLLAIDITDPVKMAQAQMREAELQLQFDRNRGAMSDVLLQDEVALRQARSDAAGAAWDQEFSDQRTNYELQRTSLSAYLSYLRSQHNYLTAVKDKTRQQVEQLNQVDQALKGLTEGLQGQWNLGDIKVPTAYEMRRQIAGGMAAGVANVSYVNITMTGSSTAEMQAALEGALGQPILQSVATAPPKVG